MSHPYKAVFSFLAILLSAVGLFLSAWIVLPAPTMLLLILAVGAPEVSPWLLGFHAIALLFSWLYIRRRYLQRLAYIASLTGLLICASVLVNIAPTQGQMAAAIAQNLGADYLEKIPQQVRALWRSHPFSLRDSLFGIHTKSQPTNISFKTSAGIKLNMQVYQPPKVGKYPAIVVIYGGAWRTGSPIANPEFNQYMALRGYTVFAIDYRHAPEYRFPAQLDDVRAALNFIRTHAVEYQTDPEQMILLGRSAGAHLAMLAAYQPDAPPIRAVVSYYGPVNLTEGYNNPPRPDPINTREVLKAFLGGSPQELANEYKIASPINYVTRPLPPTLLVYGSRDNLVQAKYGRQMYQTLQTSGNTAVFLEIPWAEHAFDEVFNGVSNQLALYYTERFIAWALFRTM
jgi:acetyl esterase/lipase